jgi:AcrR family transcriptional regulator
LALPVVGRVTLYGHVSSREELVEAVVKEVMRAAEGAFEAARTDTGPAVDALSRLVRASWHALDGSAGLHAAAVLAFGEEWVRANHGDMLERVAELVDRGRAEGGIRTDLPASWLVSVVYGVIHTAADEVAAGRLAASAAGETIDATVRGALAASPSG